MDQSIAGTTNSLFTPSKKTERQTCCVVFYDPFSFFENDITSKATRSDILRGAIPKYSCEIRPRPELLRGIALTIGSSFDVCCPKDHKPTVSLFFERQITSVCEVLPGHCRTKINVKIFRDDFTETIDIDRSFENATIVGFRKILINYQICANEQLKFRLPISGKTKTI